MLDPRLATVEGSALIRAKAVGKTMLELRDHRNKNNKVQISVEIAPIHSLEWLEDQLELQTRDATGSRSIGGRHFSEISTIALDKRGQKFTNCTGAAISYHTKNQGTISVEPIAMSYK